MTISENLTEFAGKRVQDFVPKKGLARPRDWAYRVSLSYDESEEGKSLSDKLTALLADKNAGQLESLVIGAWGDMCEGTDSVDVVEALSAASGKLPGLRHLFFGDVTVEECEISWIKQSDVSPILSSYPNLEHLTVRGGDGLSFGTPRHEKLRELVVQSGGLSVGTLHEIASGDFPALEHLELWLGEENYGGDATVEDLAPLLRGDRFPRLRFLGLKDSPMQDEIAAVVAVAPVVKQLSVLDLSMGTLGDAGARALLESPAIRGLKKLDLHHHYISDELVAELKKLGIEVDASDRQTPDQWQDGEHRYIAVAE